MSEPYLYYHDWKCGHDLYTPQPVDWLKTCQDRSCRCEQKIFDNYPITRDQFYGRSPMPEKRLQ